MCGPTYHLSWKMSHGHLRKMCVLLPMSQVFCLSLLDPSELLCYCLCFFTYLLSACHTHCWERRGVDVPNYYCRTVCLPLPFYPFWLHALCWSVIRCMGVYKYISCCIGMHSPGSYLDGASTPVPFRSGHLAQKSQMYPNGFAPTPGPPF